MTCPQVPMGLAAACDWALMVPCLFGDVTKPPSTVFVHTLMLPVRHIPLLIFKLPIRCMNDNKKIRSMNV